MQSNSFHKNQDLESWFEDKVLPFVGIHGCGEPVKLIGQSRGRTFQLQGLGDWLVSDGACRTYELKVEEKQTGNLFIEAWSNRATCRAGWFLTCKPDWLLYGFRNDNVMYLLSWPKLKEVLWHPEYAVDKCKFVKQQKHQQDNDTWGWLVPLSLLQEKGCIERFMPIEIGGNDREPF